MSGSEQTPTSGDDVPEISYESARTELAEVVRRLEAGGQSLEESLELWQRGEDLAAICQHWLDSASARLDEAIQARDSADN
ncbi:Exodeoxyribonuclease VII small subunit [Frankineae bacterium MT45]|nr:Exodeoxyribonuclease VII small subunit [Frankineae bacterium MT45]